MVTPPKFKVVGRRSGFLLGFGLFSGDSGMYPYQRTPMGNPYISPIYPDIVGVYGLLHSLKLT